MKKKVMKGKLSLSRETLVQLENERVAVVVGASGRPICCTASGSCPPPPSAETGCC
jgi:hypothetical protein